MEEASKKSLIAILVLILVLSLFLGGIFYFKKANQNKQQIQKQTEMKKTAETSAEKMEKTVAEQTNFAGKIRGMQKPKDGSVVILKIDASLIDKDKVKELDYSSGPVTMPMIKKEFSVVVDESTKLNVSSLNKIQMGDWVSVTAPKSIYETDSFTAVKLDVITQAKNIK